MPTEEERIKDILGRRDYLTPLHAKRATHQEYGNIDTSIELVQGIHEESEDPIYPLGARLQIADRVFRYARVKEPSRGRAVIIGDYNRTELGAHVAAEAGIGDRSITWTSQADIVENEFAGGYMFAQGGFFHRIRANTGVTGGEVATFYFFEPLTEAIADTRYVVFLSNPYNYVCRHSIANEAYDGTGAGRCVGVTTFDMTDGYYAWIQTWGPCSVIATPATLGDNEGEIALCVGEHVGDEIGITTGYGKQIIGHSMTRDRINWEDENFVAVWLCIDP